MNDTVTSGLIARILPDFSDRFLFGQIPPYENCNIARVSAVDDKILLEGDCPLSRAFALGLYLKRICKVNLSWTGNRTLNLTELPTDFSPVVHIVEQRYRVYMNYCTLNYTMSWWDWSQWEKEIDFMALNGINMPLAVVGTEAVWYETLLEYGFEQSEALKFISGPSFWAWHLMTNIESYQPPQDVSYVYDRLALGKKIMNRFLEYGMYPIQQGFSGHVPVLLKAKYPQAKIQLKRSWCDFPKTAQLDPTDPLFPKMGNTFLQIQEKLLGSHHYYACDPFHEGAPPKNNYFYLRKVGKIIDKLYRDFDPDSKWVMQSWSIRSAIAKAVPKNRLLILDLDGARCKRTRNFWGYDFVSGHLHNFGGKNSLHGDLAFLAENKYAKLRQKGAHVVGAGLFPEGVEQNPVYYDLLFEILTCDRAIDLQSWLDDYVIRRYGQRDERARQAWEILSKTCYGKTEGYEEERGSVLCARPSISPKMASPNDRIGLRYDNAGVIEAAKLLLSCADTLSASDGWQFDVCDLTRQALSNLIVLNQSKLPDIVKSGQADEVRAFARMQIAAMRDLDALLSHRSELTLARWITDAHRLARNDAQKKYFDRCARMLLTIWGDFDADAVLYDYAWREWNGLIAEYYIPRWERFYEMLEQSVRDKTPLERYSKPFFFDRPRMQDTRFGKELGVWEKNWVDTYSEYPTPTDSDVTQDVQKLLAKYFG